MKRVICFCLMTWICPSGSARPQRVPITSPSIVGLEIPFELRQGFLLVVEGRIAQHGGLKFVLDTGSTYSIVNRKLAEKLAAPRSSGNVFNFNKIVAAKFAEFSEVQFGPVEVHHASLMISDLVSSSNSGEIDAVIGLDLLCVSRSVLIDYSARKIRFQVSKTNRGDPAAQHAPPFFLMQVMLQGNPARLLVDTGMQGILLYEDRLHKRLPRLKFEVEKRRVRVGLLQVKRAAFPGFLLGTNESVRTVFLMNGPADDLTGIDGYLGMSALNAQQVELDFEDHTMAWRE